MILQFRISILFRACLCRKFADKMLNYIKEFLEYKKRLPLRVNFPLLIRRTQSIPFFFAKKRVREIIFTEMRVQTNIIPNRTYLLKLITLLCISSQQITKKSAKISLVLRFIDKQGTWNNECLWLYNYNVKQWSKGNGTLITLLYIHQRFLIDNEPFKQKKQKNWMTEAAHRKKVWTSGTLFDSREIPSDGGQQSRISLT